MNQEKSGITILYVIGAGRSGSTVLDTVLGNHDDAASFGEIINLPTSGWKNNEYCACGNRAMNCPFWTRVRQIWQGKGGDVERYRSLQTKFERLRCLPNLLLHSAIESRSLNDYARLTATLYRSIVEVSGKRIIVDSSKHPARALALSLNDDINLKLIHLVRDGRGVLWSYKKRFDKNEAGGVQSQIEPKPTWQIAIQWMAINLFSELAASRVSDGKRIRLRYEDFVASPKLALKRVGEIIDLDMKKLGTEVSDGRMMSVGHIIAGNRLRMKGRVRLNPDMEWKKKLAEKDKQLFESVAGWLVDRYGYHR